MNDDTNAILGVWCPLSQYFENYSGTPKKYFAIDLGFLMFISSFGGDLEFISQTFNEGFQYPQILAKDYYTLRKVEKSLPVLDR